MAIRWGERKQNYYLKHWLWHGMTTVIPQQTDRPLTVREARAKLQTLENATWKVWH